MLWDIRKSSNAEEAGLVTEMDGHIGPVTHLYMDQHKIVSGGPEDSYVNVWEADTGTQTTSLICSELDDSGTISGCFAMAVDGCRVVTCSYDEQMGLVRFRDFDKATNHISLDCNKIAYKFWGQGSYGYADESDD